MTNILNQVAKSHHSKFSPSDVDDYFTLRLAKGLGEPEAANHYAVLASEHSEAKMLCAYRKAITTQEGRPAKVFHEYLASGGGDGSQNLPRPRLMAVRIERRVVAIALFSGTHLEGWRVRTLTSDPDQAEATTKAFILAMLNEHNFASVALETVPAEIARASIHRVVVEQCRAGGKVVWEVSKKLVAESLAHPAPKSRDEVRAIMLQIWPLSSLNQSQTYVLDAFALGLYVQTERLLDPDFQP
jgi:hypothetical protein